MTGFMLIFTCTLFIECFGKGVERAMTWYCLKMKTSRSMNTLILP